MQRLLHATVAVLFCCWVLGRVDLQSLLDEVVAELLDHHVALTGGHGLVVDANHERLTSLLHGDTT
jgi:hypothetical protein